MLLLDGEKISAKQFCEKFGIDYNAIKKNPVFEMEKSRHKGVNKGPTTFPARCFIRDKSGSVLELRYAQTRNVRIVKNEKIDSFSPKNIKLEAVKTRVATDEDKLIFMFANPNNIVSPFGNGKNSLYTHVDPALVAAGRMKAVNATKKAMDYLDKMSDEELIIFAKGFQASYQDKARPFNPFVDGTNTDVDIVRVSMMEFCNINPQSIVDLHDNQLGKIRGQIVSLIDNGIVVMDASTGVRQWRWAKGERQGQPIGNQILDAHSDARDYLLTYIQANLHEYLTTISSTSESISAEQSALNFLASKKKEEVVHQESLSYEGLPQSYAECQAWLGENGFKKAPAIAKKLKEGIEEKKVHTMNIHDMAKQYEHEFEFSNED